MMPLRFGITWDGAPYTVLVSIYFNDGTVAIAHGGVEIGQGINTKVIWSPCIVFPVVTYANDRYSNSTVRCNFLHRWLR